MKSAAAAALSAATLANAFKTSPIRYIDPANPPHQVWPGDQLGYNDCQNYADSKTGKCQDLWINSLDDFCLFAPPTVSTIGNSEREEVTYCVKAGHGTRLMPPGTITGATMVRTPKYVQIKGTGNFNKINVAKVNDGGGELDPWGYDQKGNPIGGIIFANIGGTETQIVEWTQFISEDSFCIRACYPSDPGAYTQCQHQYDEMGCDFNMPGAYKEGVFETCEGKPDTPAGLYVLKNGTTSTWHQGVKPTPAPGKPAPTSNCKTQKTISYGSYGHAASGATKIHKTTTKKSSHKPTATHKHASHKSTKHHKPTGKAASHKKGANDAAPAAAAAPAPAAAAAPAQGDNIVGEIVHDIAGL